MYFFRTNKCKTRYNSIVYCLLNIRSSFVYGWVFRRLFVYGLFLVCTTLSIAYKNSVYPDDRNIDSSSEESSTTPSCRNCPIDLYLFFIA